MALGCPGKGSPFFIPIFTCQSNHMRKHFLILALLSLLSIAAQAQLFRRYHAHKTQTPPKAILVRLATAASRIDYYAKKGNTKSVQLLLADAAAQREHMIADFKAHFTYCPVYYFYDTAQTAIKAKNFSYLLDGDMKPATNLVISPTDSDYFIVYYGYLEEPKTLKNDPNEYSSASSDNSVKMLAALYPDFTALSRKLPY
jgi:hypothetical protein